MDYLCLTSEHLILYFVSMLEEYLKQSTPRRYNLYFYFIR